MITPLKKTALHDLLNKPILFDANIFMVGISDRISDKNCSFVNMKKLYIEPLFESFTDIYKYTTIFNNIAGHELVNYVRGRSKDCGEVYSLAYAAYYNMNYFCSKEIMVDNVAHELEDLKDIDIITFDIILLSAYVYYAKKSDNSNSKGLKSMYKKYCADVIKRHGLPPTLGEYIKASQDYL